jgi:hypothetical protein
MSAIHEKLLINPRTHEVAAKLTEASGKQTVEVYEQWLLRGLSVNGIAVPGGFIDGKCYILLTDKPEWFAKAFTEVYYRHGLMQGGYYWVRQEDYTGPQGEIDKALRTVLEAFKKTGQGGSDQSFPPNHSDR